MAPKGFDRFMVDVHLSFNPKIGRLRDCEFRCLICGVWSLAAEAEPRGYLVVAGHAATERDVSHRARCSIRVARETLEALRHLGMLEWDEERQLERCHDWELINPPPKVDNTAAERQRRHRLSRRDSRDGHAAVTPPEVEVEGEEQQTSSLRSDVVELFEYWQERTGHGKAKLTPERESKVKARLRQGYSVLQIRAGIDGAALNPPRSDDGVVHDDLVSICRNGGQLERYIARSNVRPLRPVQPAGQRAADWETPEAAERVRLATERLRRDFGSPEGEAS